MNITIRPETEEDYRETERLTREAFWDIYKPGCDEHLVLHKIRSVPAFVKELDFIALHEHTIIGNIIYSRAKVINGQDREHEVLTMGPLSVLPSYQKQGIGAKLMNYSLVRAKKMEFNAVLIFGDPEYYQRFGFKNAGDFGIQTSDGGNFDAFMALELYEDSLRDINGRFHEDPVFHVDNGELEEFEKGFPYREKHVTPTQLQ